MKRKVKSVEQKFVNVLFQTKNISDVELVSEIDDLNIRTPGEFRALMLVALRETITELLKLKKEKKVK